MKYIKYDGIRIYYDFKLLFSGFLAITLFGRVYCRLSKNRLYDYLNTNSGGIFVNHEKIHIEQSKSFRLRWFSFYVVYLYYWFINLFKYGFNKHAYYNIPFEREAYSNQDNFSYIKEGLVDWKKYKNNNMMEEKKKKNWVFPTVISLIVVMMACLFLFGYHSPVEFNDSNKEFILNELKNDSTLDSIASNTIMISPNVGSLVEKEGKKVIKSETVQDFSFKTMTDSTETKYEGWLVLDKKFMGYNIIEVRVNK